MSAPICDDAGFGDSVMKRSVCSAVFVVVVLACTVARTLADQGISANDPAFDVASIKPVDTRNAAGFAANLTQMVRQINSGSGLTMEPGGRWLVRAATLRSILQSVYRDYSRPELIAGGPTWIDSQYFEIDARAPAGATPEDVERMAKRLLADRFKLQVRTAIRALDVYALTVTRDDRRLGPGMRPPTECELQPTSFEPDGRPVWGVGPRCRVGLRSEGGVQLLAGGSAHISELVRLLQLRVDRPIVDRTDLTGPYAIRLEVPRLLPAEPGAGSSDMITAVREQLGLSLVPRTEQTTVLMIDYVEMPTPN
jgi:uncharacterized protein (TIGR03435 family)